MTKTSQLLHPCLTHARTRHAMGPGFHSSLMAGCPAATGAGVKHTSWTTCLWHKRSQISRPLLSYDARKATQQRRAAPFTNRTQLSCQESCYGAQTNCQGDASVCVIMQVTSRKGLYPRCLQETPTQKADVCALSVAIPDCVMRVCVCVCVGVSGVAAPHTNSVSSPHLIACLSSILPAHMLPSAAHGGELELSQHC